MIWKLLNRLFGWDYIYWRNSVDDGIARVYKNDDGVVYYFRYKNILVIDVVKDPKQVIWLTCASSKYFNE